jgi:WD repeat-containing protein 48
METVAHWCSVDTRTGCLTCVLEEHNCFDAEMYADEVEMEEQIEFKEDQRINLGKWILRYLFANLIDEELRRDEEVRQQLFAAKYPGIAAHLERTRATPGRIQIPSPNITSWLDTSSTPTSASTLKPINGLRYPQTPGLAIGLATPGGPMTFMQRPTSPLLSPEEHPPLEGTTSRTSSDRHSNDYFTSRPLSGGTQTSATLTNNHTSSPTLNGRLSNDTQQTPNALAPPSTEGEPPATPSTEKSGLFSKKFRMNLIPKSLKKDKSADPKAAVSEEQQSDSDGRNSQADDRLNEDSFVGSLLRMRYTYELQSKSGVIEQPNKAGVTSSPTNATQSTTHDPPGTPQPVPSSILPSMPNETPVLKPPAQTIILIQEESADSGGVTDLWEGTVGNSGREADIVERVAPAWLADVLLRNTIPLKDLVKVSFVLEPWQGLLPAVSTDGNTRLNANRMLRARKIMAYIAERIEPQPREPDPNAMKPEEYLELYCHDQVRLSSLHPQNCANSSQIVPPTMTLATIRTHVWRGGGDVLMYYKANGRKPILNFPQATAGSSQVTQVPQMGMQSESQAAS